MGKNTRRSNKVSPQKESKSTQVSPKHTETTRPPSEEPSESTLGPATKYFCGIDGSTHCTRIVVINAENGERKWEVIGNTHFRFDSNYAKIAGRLVTAVQSILNDFDDRHPKSVDSICMVLSGIDNLKSTDEFEKVCQETFEKKGLCNKFIIRSEVEVVARTHSDFVKQQENESKDTTLVGTEHGDEENVEKKTTGGITIQAGTGSFCKVHYEDATDNKLRYSVDEPYGPLEQISAGGGAFWIARTAVEMFLREDEDYLPIDSDEKYTKRIRELFVEQFRVSHKYFNPKKLFCFSKRADFVRFAKKLAAEVNDDPVIQELFRAAGVSFGKLVANALLQHPQMKEKTVKCLLSGSVFLLFKHLYAGFIEELKFAGIGRVEFYLKKEESAVAAAVFVASQESVTLPMDEKELEHVVLFARTR
ncbi:unnamed protein product [Caenorhabditis sp. 36 PRJEB53466]|nr:unnamed protein product [Caenorhabditis sp. 36 PRJEB53466]